MSDFSILLPDGANFKPNKKQIRFIQTNSKIQSFLESGQDSSISLIVGQKGSGKSIIIGYKSYKDRTEDTENKKFIPEEGVERIDFNGLLSSNELSRHVKFQNWEQIHKVSIYYFILCKLEGQLAESDLLKKEYDFENIFKNYHDIFNPNRFDFNQMSLGGILFKCITNRNFVYDTHDDFISNATLLIKSYISKREVRLYIDNIDQALHSALFKESSNKSKDFEEILNVEKEEKPDFVDGKIVDLEEFIANNSFDASDKSVKSWFGSHVGFLLAIYSINLLSRKLNIYATFRLEAYEYFEFLELRNNPQYRSIKVKINYTEHDFKEIYDKLIHAAEIDKTEIERLSLDILPHNYVENVLYNKESLWSFVKRHTFLNPREITFQIMILKEILEDYKGREISKEIIHHIFTNRISKDGFKLIIRDLYAETLPFFPRMELIDFYYKNKKNYIKKANITSENRSLILILYRLGLVGTLSTKGNIIKQKFLNKNVYFSNEKQSLPESDYYLFHPTLDHILIDKFPNDKFYYPKCIIGNQLDFVMIKSDDYYLPKLKNQIFKNQFKAFYNLKNSFDKYQAINESIINIWGPKIWDYTFDVNYKNKWFDLLSEEINNGEGFHGTKKSNLPKNLNCLVRNYKLRVVICLSSLSGLIPDNREFIESVFNKYQFPNITYFGNIRGFGNKFSQYLSLMSDFEIDMINKVVENPILSDKLILKLTTNTKLKDEFNSLLLKMSNQLSSYKS